MSELVKRLRDRDAIVIGGLFHAIPVMKEAADWIEHLEAVDLAKAKLLAAQQWQPIETAPKDVTVLLYGPQVGKSDRDLSGWDGCIVASGYWDGIDGSWCVTGSTWRGPFMGATHWMPLPAPPVESKSEDV